MKKKFSVLQQANEHASGMISNNLHYKILENQIENINSIFMSDMLQNGAEHYDFDSARDASVFNKNIEELAKKLGIEVPQT